MKTFEQLAPEREPRIQIFRIEDDEGNGPFLNEDIGPNDFPNQGSGYKSDPEGRKLFLKWYEENRLNPGDIASGTPDGSRLTEYFPKEFFQGKHGEKYKVSVYDIPQESVFSGNFESVFKKTDARLLRRYSFEEFAKLSFGGESK